MRMMNPNLPPGDFSEVEQESFDLVWEPRGWIPAPVLPNLAELSADQVLAEVDGDPARAAVAYVDESRGRGRVKLLATLERIARPAADTSQPPAAPDLGDYTLPDISKMSAPAVLAEVGADPTKALAALSAERTGDRRKGLLKKLEALTAHTDPAAGENQEH